MTPIADDISDALKALREEIPPWRKPPRGDARHPMRQMRRPSVHMGRVLHHRAD